MVILFLLTFAAVPTASAAIDAALAASQDDAALNDVTFIDLQRGWSVGDRGAIWQTLDGGRHWQPQESGVTCRLSAVQFVDPQRGWAAGGYFEPLTQLGHGVLLRTLDGGAHWEPVRQPLLGCVLGMRFFDARRGTMLTLPTTQMPCAVLTTDDGGHDWTPLSAPDGMQWNCGDFPAPRRCAVAADGGRTGTFDRDAVREGPGAEIGLRRPACLKLADGGRGYLVGDGGLILSTRDGGVNWDAPPGRLPQNSSEINWQAVAVEGPHVWIAGSPGSRVLHSANGGATWDSYSTGTTLPIRAMTFTDATHGWAVGALGQILATADGGRTWQAQRAANRRAGYLAMFAEPDAVPLEVLARLSAGEGYYGVVELLGRRDVESQGEPPLARRLRTREALLAAGACDTSAAWQFPLRQAGLSLSSQKIIDGWQLAADGDPRERLAMLIAREIRAWRPEIILTHASEPRMGDSRGTDPLGNLVHAATLQAVKLAAGTDGVADPPALAGSTAWKVRRIIVPLPEGRLGEMTVSGAQLLPQLDRSLSDYVTPARGLLDANPAAVPASTSYQVAWSEVGEVSGGRDFFSGLVIRSGGDARRGTVTDAAASLQQLRRAADRRQMLQAIVTHGAKASRGQSAWLAQISTLTRDLDDASAAALMYQLACRYRTAGDWDLAADSFAQLAERYPAQTPVSAVAAQWLAQYYGSGELAYRARRDGRMPARPIAQANLPILPIGKGSAEPSLPAPTAGKQSPADQMQVVQVQNEQSLSVFPAQRGGVSLIGSTDPTVDDPAATRPGGGKDSAKEAASAEDIETARRRLATLWSNRLETISADLAAEPHSIWPRIRSLAAGGPPGKAERLVLGMMRSRDQDAWWACAASERWLADPKTTAPSPKPVWHCPRTGDKPKLDGRLDDPCWQPTHTGSAVRTIALKSALGDDASWTATAQLCHDDEFLYFAVTCRHALGVDYTAATGPRSRDADLARHDHVRLMLDTDRDWTTYYRLAVDHRGFTREDVWGDTRWNPTWYVAAATADGTWTCEAAIPWSELAAQPPRRGQAWGMGIERLVPGVGFQSWTTPAAASEVRAEGFGLLIFD
ncbi:MAG: hypothetical protein K8T25_03510 [Planctomycetia bacterium]|nr:hypothetical protein [Planctomycetia bacterium]